MLTISAFIESIKDQILSDYRHEESLKLGGHRIFRPDHVNRIKGAKWYGMYLQQQYHEELGHATISALEGIHHLSPLRNFDSAVAM